jgi:outer membrane lipoprotein carrier protein
MRVRRLAHGFLAGALLLSYGVADVASAADDSPATTQESVARVQAYLGSLETLSAEFVQVVRNRQGQISSRATGTLSISRPDRFRWDYREPYVQTIVADGRKLWLYDSDLDQVTVRALESGLGSTPAMLLSGAGRVSEGFTGGAVERDGSWTWCRLVPRERSSDFERVSLGFDSRGELAAMRLDDKLGQSTELEFGRVRRNAPLEATLFRFVPPAGADVIGDASP